MTCIGSSPGPLQIPLGLKKTISYLQYKGRLCKLSSTPRIMEPTYSFLVLVVLLILLLLKPKLKLKNKSHPHPKLPPGPWLLPIFGSIHHLLGSQPPHRLFQQLSKRHGPLIHLKLGEVSVVVAASADAAREIMKTHDVTFATRPLFPVIDVLTYGGKNLSFAPYGEYWRQLRKICVLELLSAVRVHSFRSIREEEARNLIQHISSSSRHGTIVNLSKLLVQMTNDITLRAVMGNKFKDQDGFIEALYEGIELSAGFDLADLFPSLSWLVNLVSRSKSKVERCRQKMDQIVGGIVQEHRDRRRVLKGEGCRGEEEQVAEDLVDVLLRIQEEGDLQFELTDRSIKALILDMFSAGSETSSSTLQWAMSELMRNPRAMKKVQMEVRDALEGKAKVSEADIKELNYLQLVIKETMRLHPPLPLLLPRECQKRCELLGYEIPAKSRVVVNAWAIGRDPEYWKDAQEFIPERFEGSSVDFKGTNFEFLPFGAGRRMCPGMLFGLASVELPLAELLYYFDWVLPTDTETKSESLDISESFGITSRRKFDLMLHATSLHIPQPEQ